MQNGLSALSASILEDARRRVRPLQPLARTWLGRPFSARAPKRILLVYMPDKIAWPQFYPFFHYEERFAKQGYAFRAVPFPAAGADRLAEDATAIFLQAPYVPQPLEIESVLKRLKRLNPAAPITFFDWFAPTDARFAGQVADHVAFYAKKALLRDRRYYAEPQPTHTALEAYYSSLFSLKPDEPDWDCRPDIVDRLVLAPGFATAPALLRRAERLERTPAGPRTIDIHARFATASAGLRLSGRDNMEERTHWYVAMRKHAHDKVAALAQRYAVAWQGRVDGAAFMAELEHSQLCFSPFGFGELCWRDIEAILAGAVLVKPDMAHLECFCDLYRPGETYVPVRWDLADLDETVARLLADPDACHAIAERAFVALKAYIAGPELDALLNRLTMGAPPKPEAMVSPVQGKE